MLDALTADWMTIGATGTHGKTTTTALIVSALRGVDADPSFVVGGELATAGTNGYMGTDDLLVIEADEAFRTFESLHLNGLVVTNIEAEHLDHFGTEADLADSFAHVAANVDGPVLACIDDRGAAEIASRVGASTYGFESAAEWVVSDLKTLEGGSSFLLKGPGVVLPVSVRLPGRHVALNAAGAIALLTQLGYEPEGLAKGVGQFRGVGRRWDHRGTVGDVTLIDDYAHHPTEIRATVEAARSVATGRVWAVFQPHLYSRTERFSDDFGSALALADEAMVTDVYGARETPVPGITGQLVVDATIRHGGSVRYVPHRADLATALVSLVKPGDLVISMGAGDITLLHAELAPLIADEL